MSSSARATALVLIFGSIFINLSAQSPDPAKISKPTGSISGAVTIKDKGLAGIGVTLRRLNQSNPFETLPRATTDQEGHYKISSLDPGTYQVQTSLSAYVVADENKERSVIVGEGENVEDINFSMVKGGVITGRITDADGRPVIQEQVRLLRAAPTDTRVSVQPSQPRVSYPVNTTSTDDRGIYRLFGLTAGRYQVSCGRSDTTPGPPSGLPGRISYKEVLYPDANEPSKAAVLEVREGSEATNIDIVLGRPSQTYSASGRIVDGETGEPFPGIRFGVQRILAALNRTEGVNSLMTTNTAGDFVVEGLTPGKYSVMTFAYPSSEFRTDGTFDIIDSNLTGLTIRLIKGASISGMVVVEAEDKRVAAKLKGLELMAFVRAADPSGSGNSRSTINPDGSFRVAGLPGGNARFMVIPTIDPNAAKGMAVARVEREGIVQRGIDIKDGEQVTGVRVVVTYGDAVLRGIVNIENGPLPPGARIVVRLTRSGEEQTSVRPPTVDERGRFLAESVPPGTYDVVVTVFGPGIKPQPPVKQQVALQNGVTTEVTIPFSLTGSPKP